MSEVLAKEKRPTPIPRPLPQKGDASSFPLGLEFHSAPGLRPVCDRPTVVSGRWAIRQQPLLAPRGRPLKQGGLQLENGGGGHSTSAHGTPPPR